MRRSHRCRLAISLAGSIFLAACRREAPAPVERQDTLVPVGAVVAQKAGIRAVIHVSGMVVPAQGGEFLVLAPEPARLVEVTKVPGDMVQSGDVLARFDVTSAAQAVTRLTAELAAAQAQLENARINVERMRGFVERGLVPRRDLDVADRELVDAQSATDRARTALAAAQAGAARGVVRAPFDGIVANRTHNPGDMIVSSTDPVLRVVDPRRLEIIAAIPRKEQSRVVTGASARVAAAGVDPIRLTVAGRATDVSAAASAKPDLSAGGLAKPDLSAGALAKADREAAEEAVPFRLVFTEPSKLPVDTAVQLDIDAEERTDTVLVPAEALIRAGAETAVFVAVDSRAQRRVVTTGIEDEARVEITSGIGAGELVITRGHIGLRDGAAITVASGR